MAEATIPPVASDPRDEAHPGPWMLAWRRYRRSAAAMTGLVLVGLMALMAILGPWIAPKPYAEIDPRREAFEAKPSREAWLGRDALGRDVLSRVLHGAHLTLGVGVATVGIGLLLGVPLGLVSGYFGGRVDQVMMRLTDILLAFPDILLALAIMAALGPSLLHAMLAVGFLFIPKIARVVRASALAEATRDYVAAEKALGASHLRIMVVHVLPNCIGPLTVVGTLGLGTAILYTSALSFIGLGAQPPLPEWGTMLFEGKDSFARAPHLMIAPGAAIMLAVLGANLVGDGMRDALDVRL